MNREDWNKAHKVCPKCNNTKIAQTLAGPIEMDGVYFDDINKAWCNECGWRGMAMDLKPDPSESKEMKTAQTEQPVRTIEDEKVIYAAIPDVIETFTTIQKAVTSALPHESTIKYTDEIFMQIKKTLAKIESTHRNQS